MDRIFVPTSFLAHIVHVHSLTLLETFRTSLFESLLGIENPIKTTLADEEAPQHRYSTERTHYCPDNLQ